MQLHCTRLLVLIIFGPTWEHLIVSTQLQLLQLETAELARNLGIAMGSDMNLQST